LKVKKKKRNNSVVKNNYSFVYWLHDVLIIA
jgi:hypothetical protein